MALARVKTWSAGDVLTAADLNAEFNNVLNNALTLISPLTGNLNVNNTQMLSMLLENLGATPTAAHAGRLVFQTAQNQPQVDDGTAIRQIPAIMTSSMAAGDLIVASTATGQTFKNFPVGTPGQPLTVSSSSGTNMPIWGGTVTNTLASLTGFIGSSTGTYTVTASAFTNLPGLASAALTLSSGNKVALSFTCGTSASVIVDGLARIQCASSLVTVGPFFTVNNGSLTPLGSYTFFGIHTVTSSETGAQTFNIQMRGDGTNPMTLHNSAPEGNNLAIPSGLLTVYV